MKYPDYLRSKKWLQRATQAKEEASYQCQLCASNKSLNVHHRTYERVGKEAPMDLIVLCEPCHKFFHEKLEECRKKTAAITQAKFTTSILGKPAQELGLTDKDRYIFIQLSYYYPHMNKSTDELVDMTGCSLKTIEYTIGKLIDLGFLKLFKGDILNMDSKKEYIFDIYKVIEVFYPKQVKKP